MAGTHTHGDAPPHEHEGATPGHTHEGYGVETEDHRAEGYAPGTPAHEEAASDHTHDTAVVDVRPSVGGLMTRIVLSVLGAAGMIIGAFLPWAFGDEGITVGPEVFYTTNVSTDASVVTSAGGIVILLGLLALVGMAFRTGWLTSLAGVLGIVAFVLVLITLYRLDESVADVELGLWLVLAGGALALIGGFFGTRPTAVATGTSRY